MTPDRELLADLDAGLLPPARAAAVRAAAGEAELAVLAALAATRRDLAASDDPPVPAAFRERWDAALAAERAGGAPGDDTGWSGSRSRPGTGDPPAVADHGVTDHDVAGHGVVDQVGSTGADAAGRTDGAADAPLRTGRTADRTGGGATGRGASDPRGAAGGCAADPARRAASTGRHPDRADAGSDPAGGDGPPAGAAGPVAGTAGPGDATAEAPPGAAGTSDRASGGGGPARAGGAARPASGRTGAGRPAPGVPGRPRTAPGPRPASARPARAPRRVRLALVVGAAAALVGVGALAAPEPPVEPARFDLATAARSALGVRDAGALADPARRAACLAALAVPGVDPAAPLIAGTPVEVDGRAGVLLVLPGGRLGLFRVVVVDPGCGPGGGELLDTGLVGG